MALLLADVSPSPAQTNKDHPVISAYPGAILSRREDAGYSEYHIVTSINPQAKTDEEIIPGFAVHGTLTRLAYENPKGRSALEIFTNYKEALEKAGFTILVECHECGVARNALGRVNEIRYRGSDMRFLNAQLKQGDKETYVAIAMINLRHQIEVLERAEMERGLVVVTPELIEQGLMVDGRVVLEGIYFDTDKSTLKPESDAALRIIANYLTDHPDLKAYIVGHTDGTGAFDHNVNLSRERAATVVTALVDRFAIPGHRLASHGVGPLSPSRTNKNDDGRTRNRRVEMVEM
jgi:outer membrane protein OmpA-like peptidoglycan-associated protein